MVNVVGIFVVLWGIGVIVVCLVGLVLDYNIYFVGGDMIVVRIENRIYIDLRF